MRKTRQGKRREGKGGKEGKEKSECCVFNEEKTLRGGLRDSENILGEGRSKTGRRGGKNGRRDRFTSTHRLFVFDTSTGTRVEDDFVATLHHTQTLAWGMD